MNAKTLALLLALALAAVLGVLLLEDGEAAREGGAVVRPAAGIDDGGRDAGALPEGAAGEAVEELVAAPVPDVPESAPVDPLAAELAEDPELERYVLTGRVVDDFGRPREGLRVVSVPDGVSRSARELPRQAYSIRREGGLDRFADTRTDADGRFVLPDLRKTGAERERSWGGDQSPYVLVLGGGVAIHRFPLSDYLGGDRDLGELVVTMDEGIVTLRTVDERGEPVAGTQVHVSGSKTPDAIKELPGWSQQARHLSGRDADEDGLVRLEGLWPTELTLNLSAKGFLARRLDSILVVSGETTEVGDIMLSTGGLVAGRVLGPDGRPLAGVDVVAAPRKQRSSMLRRFQGRPGELHTVDLVPLVVERQRNSRNPTLVRTDEQGRFERTGLADVTVDLYVMDDVHEPARLFDVPVGTTDLELRLTDAAVLTVSLVDDGTGEPVDGAALRAFRLSGVGGFRGPTRYELPGPHVPEREHEGRPGPDGEPVPPPPERAPRVVELGAGRWQVSGAGPRQTELEIVAPGYAFVRHLHDGVEPGTRHELELRLQPSGGFTGRVLAADGEPVVEATVTLGLPRPPEARRQDPADRARLPTEDLEQLTDEEGRFTHGGLAPGDYTLMVRAEGHEPVEGHEVTVEGPGLKTLDDLVLTSAGTVVGTVLDASGSPAVTHDVYVRRRADERGGSWNSRTVGDGSFVIENVPPGLYHVLSEPGGHAEIELSAGETREVHLRLQEYPSLSGKVTAGGLPVEGATLYATNTRSWDGESYTFPVSPATTDASGAYRFELKSVGRLAVHARGPTGGGTEEVALEVDWGQDLVQDFSLGAGGLAGRLVLADAPGAPPSEEPPPRHDEVVLRLVRTGEPAMHRTAWGGDEQIFFETELEPDGRFRFDQLGPGEFRIQTRDGGLLAEEHGPWTLAAGEQRDDLVLPVVTGGRIDVQVLDAQGERAGGNLFAHPTDDPGAVAVHSVKEGRAELDGLRPGAWTLVRAPWDYLSRRQHPERDIAEPELDAEARVQVVLGQTTQVTLQDRP